MVQIIADTYNVINSAAYGEPSLNYKFISVCYWTKKNLQQ